MDHFPGSNVCPQYTAGQGKTCGLKADLCDSPNPYSSHPFQRLLPPSGVMDRSRRTISQQVPCPTPSCSKEAGLRDPSAEQRREPCDPRGVNVPGLSGPSGGLRGLKRDPRPDSEGSKDLGRLCLPAEPAFP